MSARVSSEDVMKRDGQTHPDDVCPPVCRLIPVIGIPESRMHIGNIDLALSISTQVDDSQSSVFFLFQTSCFCKLEFDLRVSLVRDNIKSWSAIVCSSCDSCLQTMNHLGPHFCSLQAMPKKRFVNEWNHMNPQDVDIQLH